MSGQNREALLARAFVTLADTLVADYDVVDVLQSLVAECTAIVDAVDAGILLPNVGGELDVVASTSDRSELISLLQLRADEGPCVEAYASGNVIVVDDIAATYARWPSFATFAGALNYQSMHAIPMRLRDETIGSLNLFRDVAGPISPDDARVAKALVDVATISILQERTLRDSRAAQEQLQRALDSRVLIEQAKGVLANQHQIQPDDAFRILRTRARTAGRRLSDVAQEVIDTSITTESLGDASSARSV